MNLKNKLSQNKGIRFGYLWLFLVTKVLCGHMVFKTLFPNILTLVTKNEL